MFRIVGGVCWLILLVVAIRLDAKLGKSEQENANFRRQLNSLAEGAPAEKESSVADEVGDQAESAALKAALSTMNGEMEKLQKQSAQEREQILRESANKGETLTAGIAEVLSHIGVSRKKLETLLADLPAGDRLRLLEQITVLEGDDPAETDVPPVHEVGVIPPPDDKPELADEPEFLTYTVKHGDSLSQIGRKFKVSVAEIMKLNGNVDARRLRIGQDLKIPQN